MIRPFSLDKSMISALGGTFYPSGYAVIMFPDVADAKKVGQKLGEMNIGDGEIFLMSPETILSQITPTTSGSDDPLPSAGTEGATVRAYTKLAREGHAGLLVRTQDEDAADRLMEVVRTVPYSMAQRYRALVIEDL